MARKSLATKVLLVEGPNDAHVFWNLLDRFGFTNDVRERNGFEIQPAGGIDGLFDALDDEASEQVEITTLLRLSIRIKSGEIERLGLVVDADSKPSGRWDSLRVRLTALGYEGVPEKLVGGGIHSLVRKSNTGSIRPPSVGIWIMPDNANTGMLEDWAQSLIPDAVPASLLLARATRVVMEIPQEERLFSSSHYSKAVIHTWLAWQNEPGKAIGQAIAANYLPHIGPSASAWMKWFQNVFELDSAS